MNPKSEVFGVHSNWLNCTTGGGGSSIITVEVNPPAINALPGGQLMFTAVTRLGVTPYEGAVTWSVTGNSVTGSSGTRMLRNMLVIHKNETGGAGGVAAGQLKVRATSNEDTTKFAEVTITAA